MSLDSLINIVYNPNQGFFLGLGFVFSVSSLLLISKKYFFINYFNYLCFLVLIGYSGNIGYRIFYEMKFSIIPFIGGSLLGSFSFVLILSICCYLFCKTKYKFMNILAIPFSLLISFGKIGCYYSKCCYGNLNFFELILPVQLVESFSYFVMTIILYIFFRNSKILIFYLIIFYSFIRFIAEYFRADNVFFISNIPITQLVSLSILILSTLFVIKIKFKEKILLKKKLK